VPFSITEEFVSVYRKTRPTAPHDGRDLPRAGAEAVFWLDDAEAELAGA